VVAGSWETPAAGNTPCPAVGMVRTARVTLARPLGTRVILDVASGLPLIAVDRISRQPFDHCERHWMAHHRRVGRQRSANNFCADARLLTDFADGGPCERLSRFHVPARSLGCSW
jgi:hypothetical protein